MNEAQAELFIDNAAAIIDQAWRAVTEDQLTPDQRLAQNYRDIAFSYCRPGDLLQYETNNLIELLQPGADPIKLTRRCKNLRESLITKATIIGVPARLQNLLSQSIERAERIKRRGVLGKIFFEEPQTLRRLSEIDLRDAQEDLAELASKFPGAFIEDAENILTLTRLNPEEGAPTLPGSWGVERLLSFRELEYWFGGATQPIDVNAPSLPFSPDDVDAEARILERRLLDRAQSQSSPHHLIRYLATEWDRTSHLINYNISTVSKALATGQNESISCIQLFHFIESFLSGQDFGLFSRGHESIISGILEIVQKFSPRDTSKLRISIEGLKPTSVDPHKRRRAELLARLVREETSSPIASKLTAATQWSRAHGSAKKYFDLHYGSLPIEQRPFAHQIRQANLKFYDALSVYQVRRGETMGDLFPIDPSAKGGARAPRREPSPEERLAAIQRRREQNRLHKAAVRAATPPPFPRPK